MDGAFYGFVVLLFAAIFLLIEGLYLWWNSAHGGGAQRIARRLKVMAIATASKNERISILKQRRFSRRQAWDRALHQYRFAHRIDRLLLQSGLKWSVEQFLACCALVGAGGLILTFSASMPLFMRVAIALACLLLPRMVVHRMRKRRLIRIEQQLPEAADFIARALRAGHSFTNVLQIVGNELPEPLSGEFRLAREEINYGVPLNEALHNMAARVPLTDLRYLVIAVIIQRESGGNLAEILGNISQIIRARLKLVAQVRVLSAEGRMSAWILGALPFVVMAMMLLINPDYIALLWTDPVGVRLLWYAAGMIVLGVFWLRKVIRIRI
ncbi:type II secretion system F family protein [Massilia sp. S19_KUP03_FR1]|uniref:type II secretion system F family protein n=1 Tax=Massilia sp. S19_KUP03_FR1 TaxID=3025503 RepID=UPI002FCD73E5